MLSDWRVWCGVIQLGARLSALSPTAHNLMSWDSSPLGNWSWWKFLFFFCSHSDDLKPKKTAYKSFLKGITPAADTKWANEMTVRRIRVMNRKTKWWEAVSQYWSFTAFWEKEDCSGISLEQLQKKKNKKNRNIWISFWTDSASDDGI